MQLLTSAASARRFWHFTLRLGASQRCTLARDIPQLCDAVLYRHLDLDRVTASLTRLDPSVRRVVRQAIRERLRARPNLQLRDAARRAERDDRGRRGHRNQPRPYSRRRASPRHRRKAARQRV